MVTKNQIKLIKSLSRKKNRDQNSLFVAEGNKTISEFLKSGFQTELLFTLEPNGEWANSISIDEKELRKISFLKNPSNSLAVFQKPQLPVFNKSDLTIALDGIQDPGNLGTIIRLCDWFGVKYVVCSEDTADCFNPKVVQASMGSLARVKMIYTDLVAFLNDRKEVVYGAFLEGDNIYGITPAENAILVMGNEGNGISSSVEAVINQKINIPQFGERKDTESLNVATATSILLSEFRRKSFTGTQS